MTASELRALRKKLNLSVADCARQCEVAARTWLRWESGERSIPRGAIKLFLVVNKVESADAKNYAS